MLVKSTGETQYSGDLSPPGMLHMKMLFAGRPHARVLSIETDKAEALPGVVAVLHSQGCAGQRIRPAEEGPARAVRPGSWTDGKPGTDIVRFEGDQVAVVVAETETHRGRGT